MEWTAPTFWWLAAGVLVAVELATGTLYLLMLALGCAAAALAAHAGSTATAQVVAAALVGGGATAMWHFKRASSPRSAPAESNRDVNLDVGETVRVSSWHSDGSASVHYRGSTWHAQFGGAGAPTPGEHVIVAVKANRLILAPQAAH